MTKAYDNLPWIVKIILQLILGWPISAIYRIVKGLDKKDSTVLLVGILCIFFGFIFWIIDLVTTIISNEISVLA